jgi:type VI secretion system Hcp family effector
MRKLRHFIGTIVGAVALLHTVVASAAQHMYVRSRGTTQGTFRGSSTRGAGWTDVLRFDHGPTTPGAYNAAAANGKKVHEPISVILKLDPATRVQWLSAQTANEALSTVTIEFVRPASDGKEVVYQTVTLSNATIEKADEYKLNPPDATAPAGTTYLKIALDYREIHTTSVATANAPVVNDSWAAQGGG